MNIFKRLFRKEKPITELFEEFDRRCQRCIDKEKCNRVSIRIKNAKCLDFDPIDPADEIDNYDIDKKLLEDMEIK